VRVAGSDKDWIREGEQWSHEQIMDLIVGGGKFVHPDKVKVRRVGWLLCMVLLLCMVFVALAGVGGRRASSRTQGVVQGRVWTGCYRVRQQPIQLQLCAWHGWLGSETQPGSIVATSRSRTRS
jgi:hypothetical protein